MGSVVGERLGVAIDHAREKKISADHYFTIGGARMMESVLSLMQMAKTSAKLAQLDKEKVPYISLMTNPTTGGVTASYAMLGDFNIAEPGRTDRICRSACIRQTIGRDLPEGFPNRRISARAWIPRFYREANKNEKQTITAAEMLAKRC
jgi:acetyl-CoA carboxylase carboxyl transferase subunit beta